MKWLRGDDIKKFLSGHDYDVRKTGNARWIDQKCAADVITIIADCILQYDEHNPDSEGFTSIDIWHDEYTVSFVESIFKKPNLSEQKAKSEYDKFFQQPMEMFANAGILSKSKKGRCNFYAITDRAVLEYIAIRERNALTFLQMYIEKVLTDSGLMPLFDHFFDKQDKSSYADMKDGFSDFTICHTKINGKVECNRIFIKVLNPLAFLRGKCGTERGNLSKGRITYDMLMYNRDNFRDIYANKPKELTRRQYAEQVGLEPSVKLNSYLSQKAKRLLRVFNTTFRTGKSEIVDQHIGDIATHIHHIFPEADFPEICSYLENLIAITPTQHLNYAHPNGNTGRINRDYQQICLIAKAGTIKETIGDDDRDQIYSFGDFMYVLFVGLSNDAFLEIEDGDFDDAVSMINLAYTG